MESPDLTVLDFITELVSPTLDLSTGGGHIGKYIVTQVMPSVRARLPSPF
jgi:hypothetical protein